MKVTVDNIPNPRVESEDHYYNPTHTRLSELRLKPHKLSDTLINSMLQKIIAHKDRIDISVIAPTIKWK